MAVLPIRKYGDPILRKKAVKVAAFDAALQQMAADMIETMQAAKGIAADLVIVRHDILGDGNTMVAEPLGSRSIIGRHRGVGKVGHIVMIKVEKVGVAIGVHRGSCFATVDKVRHIGRLCSVDIISEDT